MSRLLAPLALAAALAAQDIDPYPVLRTLLAPTGSRVDLDTGSILHEGCTGRDLADLHLDRDGTGFVLVPEHGAASDDPGSPAAADLEWSREPRRVRNERLQTGESAWLVRTDRGAVARVSLRIVDGHGLGAGVLQWALAPGALPVFVAGPRDVAARWSGDTITVRWQSTGDPEYVVEVLAGSIQRKLVTKTASVELAGATPGVPHRFRVRALRADGVVSLPVEVVCHGPRTAAVRGTIPLPKHWYDTVGGGLSLARGEVEPSRPEVVLFLYGVYVPGGGIVKVGEGGEAFFALDELPADGYRPVHERLDDHDVLAVRTADGRHAKLWLEPAGGKDLRAGARVHYAWIPDGGRRLLARPGSATARVQGDAATVRWTPVEGAVRYRIARDGAVAEAVEPELIVKDLTTGVHRLLVTALDALGEESEPRPVDVLMLPSGWQHGHIPLRTDGAQGYRFAAQALVRSDAGADLWVSGSAGGASYLRFATPHGGCVGGGRRFGDLPPLSALDLAAEVESDDRQPGSDQLLVKTAEGALVQLRIVTRRKPDVELEYLLRPAGR